MRVSENVTCIRPSFNEENYDEPFGWNGVFYVRETQRIDRCKPIVECMDLGLVLGSSHEAELDLKCCLQRTSFWPHPND